MARRILPRALTASVEAYALMPSESVYDQGLDRLRLGNGASPGGKLQLNQDDGDAIVITVPHTYVEGTDATAFLQAVADRARDLNCPWKLRNGVTYTILGTVYTYTDFDYSGAQVITTNAGQTGPVFSIAPMPGDVEAVPLATAETWTLNQGSAFVPELAGQRGWTYTIDSPLADILRTGGGNIRQGQTFTVISDDGQLSEPIHVAFTRPFAAGTNITRQRMRAPVRIRGGAIRIASSSGTTGRALVLHTSRSNSAFENCAIINETDLEILQGFVAEKCEMVTFDNTDTRGLKVNATNYGYNSNIATDLTYLNAKESGCRRGIDAHKSCNIRIISGTYPDGVGAHWYHRLTIDGGADIGCTNQNNPYNLHLAGSGLLIGEAKFRLDAGCYQGLKIRSDLFELAGPLDMGRAHFVIDNTDNQIGAVTSDVYILRLSGPNSNYDAGRPVSLPSLVDLSDVTIEVIGTTNFQIRLLTLGFGQVAAGFPQPLKIEGVARLSPKFVNVPALVQAGALDPAIVGLPAVRVDYVRNQTSTGAGYDIEMRMPGRPVRLYGDTGTCDNPTAARADVRLIDAAAGSFITARYGAVRSFDMIRCGPPSTVQISDGTQAPLGDERFSFAADARPPATNIAANRYFFGQGHSSSTGTVAVAADTLYLFAFDKTLDLNALAIEITAGAAGACRAGIYSSDAKGRPYRLIASCAELTDTSATGIKDMALAAARRSQGKLFLAMIFSGTPTLRATAASAQLLNDCYGRGGFNTGTPDAYLTAALAYGALPVNCPATAAVAATTAPALAARSV